MIKDIVKDIDILSKKSEPFNFKSKEDKDLITDMLDTAKVHEDRCVGLAAVQIGVHKRVILVYNGERFVPMFNPRIIGTSGGTYTATEGCMSLDGFREVTRHLEVKVIYQDIKGKFKNEKYRGKMAQIIQHECDHLEGVLI